MFKEREKKLREQIWKKKKKTENTIYVCVWK